MNEKCGRFLKNLKNTKFSKALIKSGIVQAQNKHNDENIRKLQVKNYMSSIILVCTKK